jgi:capsular polysaccharide export protein
MPAEYETRKTPDGSLHVLFLQGPSSFYMEQVARRLIARGHRVSRINLHFGDRLFWRLPAKDYRGRIDGWRSYIARQLDADPITHLFLLGDQRPHHRLAIEEAKARGAEIICAELGYLRPDWLVLERDGMSTFSRMPRDPQTIRALASDYNSPDFTVRFRTPFWRFTMLDMIYNLGALFFSPLYPGYRRHAIDHPLIEYASWVRKLCCAPLERRAARHAFEELKASGGPVFVLPLQLSTDYQIRAHSPYPDMPSAARDIITSFSTRAAKDARLIVKVHPLDPGITQWRRLIGEMAAEHGVSERVFYIDGGNLDAMLATAAGCVTVNSTSGLAALQTGCPLKVTGNAIFDVPGLTFQGSLDDFWTNAAPPDPDLVIDYIRLLAGALHIRGGYYTQEALDAAVPATVERLEKGLPFLPPKALSTDAGAGSREENASKQQAEVPALNPSKPDRH